MFSILGKLCRGVLFALIVAAVATSTASATTIKTVHHNNNTYHLLAPASWEDAQAEADALEGDLVTIRNLDEHDWIVDTFGQMVLDMADDDDLDYAANMFDGSEHEWNGKVNLWIGLSRGSLTDDWEWESGENSTYRNWTTDPDRPEDEQPQGNHGDEIFAGIRLQGLNDEFLVGQWIDIVEDLRLGDLNFGIVEILNTGEAPEPSALVLAATAAVGFGFVARRARRRSRLCGR